MHGVRDDRALPDDPAADAHLLDLAVDEQVGVSAVQRALSEGLDLLVEQPGDPAYLALGDPQPQALDELLDAPGRHAADIGLLDHADERLLAALSGRQDRREIAADDLRCASRDLEG